MKINKLIHRIENIDTYLVLSILFLFGIFAYLNSFQCAFQFDDIQDIVENKSIMEISYVKDWLTYSISRPLAMFTFALNYHFHKLDVFGYHLVNFLIHILNGFLVYMFIILTLSTPKMRNDQICKHKRLIALICGLLFVTHPVLTQAVTYIVQRMTSLATFCYLLSLVLYIKARLESKKSYFILSAVSALSAMLTKEIAFTLPITIAMYELIFIRTKNLKILLSDKRFLVIPLIVILPVIFLFALYGFDHTLLFREIPVQQGHAYSLNGTNYLLTQFRVIITYIRLLFIPINQNADYDFPVSNSLFELQTLLSFILIIIILISGYLLHKKYRLLSFGIFWFFITLSVESSFIPLPNVIFEHRLYLPFLGFILFFTGAFYYIFWKKNSLFFLSIFLITLVGNTALTYQRNKIWKNAFSLWNNVIKNAPNNPRAFNNRGKFYLDNANYKEALRDFNEAITLNPNYASVYNNRGTVLGLQKKYDQALKDFNWLLNKYPDHINALNNRGNIYYRTGRYDEAVQDFNKVLQLSPDKIEVYLNRGATFATMKKFPEALDDFSRVLKFKPDSHKAYNNRGGVYMEMKKFDLALNDLNKALEIKPDYVDALNNRGYLYSLIEKFDLAIENYTKAISIEPEMGILYSRRAVAHFFKNDYENSKKDVQKAQELGIEVYPNLLKALSELNHSI